MGEGRRPWVRQDGRLGAAGSEEEVCKGVAVVVGGTAAECLAAGVEVAGEDRAPPVEPFTEKGWVEDAAGARGRDVEGGEADDAASNLDLYGLETMAPGVALELGADAEVAVCEEGAADAVVVLRRQEQYPVVREEAGEGAAAKLGAPKAGLLEPDNGVAAAGPGQLLCVTPDPPNVNDEEQVVKRWGNEERRGQAAGRR